MKKILIIAAIISLLIISSSIFYYFVILSPQTQKEEKENKQQELVANCMKDGKKVYEDDTDGLKEKNAIILSPEFHYNQKLKTCLYSGSFIDCSLGQDKCLDNSMIKDVNSNKIIASFITFGNEQKSDMTLEEFTKEKNILLSE